MFYIVALKHDNPIVLAVSEITFRNFETACMELRMKHVELAVHLHDRIQLHGKEFSEENVARALVSILVCGND